MTRAVADQFLPSSAGWPYHRTMSSGSKPRGSFSDPPGLNLWNRVREREEWMDDERAALVEITPQLSNDRSTVDVTVATTSDSKQPAWELARLIADKEDIDIDVQVTFQTAESDASSTS